MTIYTRLVWLVLRDSDQGRPLWSLSLNRRLGSLIRVCKLAIVRCFPGMCSGEMGYNEHAWVGILVDGGAACSKGIKLGG